MLIDNRNPVGFRMQNVDGQMYVYDSVRSKWLSENRQFINFHINSSKASGNRWFSLSNNLPTCLSGWISPKSLTIVSVSINTKETTHGSIFKIYKNEDSIFSEEFFGSSSYFDDEINIDVLKGDVLRVKLETSDVVSYPVIAIEIAWLKTT